MEYNLQKTIEHSFMNPIMGQSCQRLSATPATDYVNPGIGGEMKLFSFYVPLRSAKPLHAIQKVVPQEQEGSGNIEEISDELNK
jgi:hypothetical protein